MQRLLFFFAIILTGAASAQGVFEVSSGTNLLVNNGTRIVLSNTNFENNGQLGLGSISRFVFTGSGPIVNTISGTGNILFGELEINKVIGYVQLTRPVSIFTNVMFTSGNLDLNGHTLFLVADPNGQLVGEKNGGRIFGNNGLVRKLATLNNPVDINPGNIGVTISSTQNLGATTIDRHHYSINGQNLRRIFHLSPSNNSSLNASLQFHYLDIELDGNNENLLSVWRSSNGTSGWTNLGGTLNTVTNTITLTGVNDLAWYTIAPSNAALPVVLSAYKVACTNTGVSINWTTSQESNSDYFDIESSISGNIWSVIGKVLAKGNSNTPTDYVFKDGLSDRKFYRLRMVDKDGKFSYSRVHTVNCGTALWSITTFPNPARNFVELTINGVNRHTLSVKMLNSAGQLFWQQQVALTNQYRKLSIPVSVLSPGIYYLVIDDPEYKQTITISKQ